MVPPHDDRAFGVTERRRLDAERLRRIWQIVEEIARQPGQTRRQLAATFALSERQIQSDLNVIRHDMQLPLVRRQGYRFQVEEESSAQPPVTLAEAQLLLVLLRRASQDPALPADRVRALLEKLPCLFPPHLRPLVVRTLQAISADAPGQQQVFTALADALLKKSYVTLHYPERDPLTTLARPVVQPDALVPYLDSWYVIGQCRQRGRRMIFDLEGVTAVTQPAEP